MNLIKYSIKILTYPIGTNFEFAGNKVNRLEYLISTLKLLRRI